MDLSWKNHNTLHKMVLKVIQNIISIFFLRIILQIFFLHCRKYSVFVYSYFLTTVMFLHRYIPPYVTMYVQSTYIEHIVNILLQRKNIPQKSSLDFKRQQQQGEYVLQLPTMTPISLTKSQYLRDVLTKLSLLLKIFTFVSLDNCVCKVFLGKVKVLIKLFQIICNIFLFLFGCKSQINSPEV